MAAQAVQFSTGVCRPLQRVTVEAVVTTSSSTVKSSAVSRRSVENKLKGWKSFSSGVKVLKCKDGGLKYTEGRRTVRIEAAKKVSSGKNLVLSSTLVVEEGNEENVKKLCDGLLAWAGEKKKDRKSGVLHFECNTDAYDQNVYHFWERYDSFPSMNEIRSSPEHCQFMNEVRPMLKEPVALAAYEYYNGQIGCMLNPIGPKGEGGLDDATGQGGSGGGASYKQTSSGVRQGINESPEEKKVWGLERALELSSPKVASAAAANAREAAVSAAAKIAEGLANLFNTNKKKS